MCMCRYVCMYIIAIEVDLAASLAEWVAPEQYAMQATSHLHSQGQEEACRPLPAAMVGVVVMCGVRIVAAVAVA